MKMGSINKKSVIMALREKVFIFGAYEVGLTAVQEAPFFSWSPDGIVLLRMESIPFDDLGGADGNLNSINLYLASLETKTRVSPRSLEKSFEDVSFDPICFYVGDEGLYQHVTI